MNQPWSTQRFICSLTSPMVPQCNINIDCASWNHRQSQGKYESALKHRTIHVFVVFANGSTVQHRYWFCIVEPSAKSTQIWISLEASNDSYFRWLCQWFHDAKSILMLHRGTIGKVNEHLNQPWGTQWFIFSLTLLMVPRCKINMDFASWNSKSILILHHGTIGKVNENMDPPWSTQWFIFPLTFPMVPRCKINIAFASWNHRQSQQKYESRGASRLIHISVDFHNVFHCELEVTMKNVMELNKNMNHGVPRGWFIFLLTSITCFIVSQRSQWKTLWNSTKIWITGCFEADSYFCWLPQRFHNRYGTHKNR